MPFISGVLTGPAQWAQLTSPIGDQNQFTVATSQTIYAGDFVSISAGVVSQSIALPTGNNQASLSGGNLPTLGIAINAVTTDSGGTWTQPGGFTQTSLQLSVALLNDTNAVWLQVAPVASTGANQALLVGSAANSSVGTALVYETAYQYSRVRLGNATTWFYGVSTTTTNGEFKMVEIYNQYVIAASAPYGWAKFKSILSSTVRQG